jgi:hypothetical protein
MESIQDVILLPYASYRATIMPTATTPDFIGLFSDERQKPGQVAPPLRQNQTTTPPTFSDKKYH